MNKTALITGASCGIGLEFAKLFAKNGDNVILVARSEEKLCEIQENLIKKYNIRAYYYAVDLTEENAVKNLFEKVTADGHNVDYLINNAGYGDNHAFLDTEWEKHENMVKLNILALMEMCRRFGKIMADRKSGRILNVASVAAFSGGPDMSVYYASKAFVLSFSDAIAVEFKRSGVSVTCICPGPTESNFAKAADSEKSRMFRYLFPKSSESVAKAGFCAMMSGKKLCYHGAAVKAMSFLSRFTPRSMNAKFAEFMNGKA